MTAGARRDPTLRALWNLRALALFLLGPVVGVVLGAEIFAMPDALVRLAGAVFLLSLGMFAVLVRGERRRLMRRLPPSGARDGV